jgi:galactitol PTS system EIIA component
MSKVIGLDPFRINRDLVCVNMEVETMIEAVTHLGDLLVNRGYVKPSFTSAVLERELTYPTGLPTKGVGTAIPHVGTEHTIKPGIAIGILSKPVKFGEMGDPSKKLDVSIIFMLSVTEPDMQIYLLESLIKLYSDELLLKKMLVNNDPAMIVNEVNMALERIRTARS